MKEAGYKRKKFIKSLKSNFIKFWYDWFGDIKLRIPKILKMPRFPRMPKVSKKSFNNIAKKTFVFFITFEILAIAFYLSLQQASPSSLPLDLQLIGSQSIGMVLLILSFFIGLLWHFFIYRPKNVKNHYNTQYVSMIVIFSILIIINLLAWKGRVNIENYIEESNKSIPNSSEFFLSFTILLSLII